MSTNPDPAHLFTAEYMRRMMMRQVETGQHDPDAEALQIITGSNQPLLAQLAYLYACKLPRELVAQPGSRKFKEASQIYVEIKDIPGSRGLLEPSRKDIRQGIAMLARLGLLPNLVGHDFGARPSQEG